MHFFRSISGDKVCVLVVLGRVALGEERLLCQHCPVLNGLHLAAVSNTKVKKFLIPVTLHAFNWI